MQFTALYSRREGTTRTDISFTALETVLDKPANAAPPHRSFADRETCCIRTCALDDGGAEQHGFVLK